MIAVAHEAGVPVLVDAAAQLPPAENLRRFIAAGADLVAFSGGKAIGGPQASGILCGRRDLIMAAALQNLDLDVFYEQWAPPARFHRQVAPQGPAARTASAGPARSARRRSSGCWSRCGCSRTRIAERRRGRWLRLMRELVGALEGWRGPRCACSIRARFRRWRSICDPEAAELSALEVMRRLEAGTPAIFADPIAAAASAAFCSGRRA